VFREAWRAGYRVFDTAVYYANDAELIAALDECGAGEEARLVHKVQPYRVADQFERLIRPKLGAAADTLCCITRRLRPRRAPDVDEAPGRAEKLVERGLVRRIGAARALRSSIPLAHANVKPAVNQIEGHPGHFDAGLGHGQERDVEVLLAARPRPRAGAGYAGVQNRPATRAPRASVPALVDPEGPGPGRPTATPRTCGTTCSPSFALDVAQMQAIDGSARSRGRGTIPSSAAASATITPTRIRVPNPCASG
jgi:hypothetical protein